MHALLMQNTCNICLGDMQCIPWGFSIEFSIEYLPRHHTLARIAIRRVSFISEGKCTTIQAYSKQVIRHTKWRNNTVERFSMFSNNIYMHTACNIHTGCTLHTAHRELLGHCASYLSFISAIHQRCCLALLLRPAHIIYSVPCVFNYK